MPVTHVGRSEDLLEELADWVRMESPSTDAEAVNRLIDVAEGELARAGATIERIPGRDGFADTLIARTPPGHALSDDKPVLIAGHLDTVWELGTIETMPYHVDGKKALGPGIHDMKAGSFLAFHALRCILQQNIPTRRPITLMLTPDEEVGSPTSREWIEREGARSAYALIPEPAGHKGACVTSRKGVGRFTMRIEGKGAHSGGGFQDGVSAVVELARQIQRIHDKVDLDGGITMNCAPVWGGSRPNVVPPEAGCEIDLRVMTEADGERMQAWLLNLQPFHPACTVTVIGEMNRPPFSETPEILALYDKARAIARDIGFDLPRQFRGGGSDGNFTAALGIPTLDGLGCPGGGAHVRTEHIWWGELARRAALLAGLLETLD
jgi:glutamate carboxypeptidase